MNPLAVPAAFFAQAADEIMRRRLRSALTILTLAVGTTALITLGTLGTLLTHALTDSLGGFDDRSFLLSAAPGAADSQLAFTSGDLAHLRRESSEIVEVLPLRSARRLARAAHRRAHLVVQGENQEVRASMLFGRTLAHQDIARNARVCVLTNGAYHRLFGDARDPVGVTLHIGEQRYTVIGVRAPDLLASLPGAPRGDILIPYTTYTSTQASEQPLTALRIVVRDARAIARTESALITALTARKGRSARYRAFDRAGLTSAIAGICSAFTSALSFMSCVTLLVAGIGVTNVMLASITERTREIGVRRALGASSAHIFMEIFSEACLIAVMGCGLGLLIASLIGWGLLHTVFKTLSVADIPWLRTIATAVSTAALLAVTFGTYPAYHAIRRTPLESLRVE